MTGQNVTRQRSSNASGRTTDQTPSPNPTPAQHIQADRHQSGRSFAERFVATRARTEALAAPLGAEDQVVQSMPDCSPAKWHLAHVTWFFETFILVPEAAAYRVKNPAYAFLFNSYYEALGERHPRPERGLLTRPTVAEVMAYRRHVTDALADLLAGAGADQLARIGPLVALGLAHEEQHQELLLMDILHLFSCNPLKPAYQPFRAGAMAGAPPLAWFDYPGGVLEIGRAPDAQGFAFDNESPRHDVLLRPFRLASRAVTNGEWMQFIADGGYRRPELWLADGWAAVRRDGWCAPLYWQEADGGFQAFSLSGLRSVNPEAPVCHVSFFEADAFARWSGRRLPSEAEWEIAAASLTPEGNTLGSGLLCPQAAPHATGQPQQMFGDVWEWTQSSYAPYPGFRAPAGAVGEYNGKFMCSQMVLKGGACVTPDGHARATYRNFFYPHQRWMFAGLRLADDA
jgi:ergothioneine biosynthesis protein EgtB